MRLWDQTCDIEQLDGDEASASLTGGVVRLARTADLVVRTSFSNEGHPSVRLDGCEGIICDLDRRERRRGEECRLAYVRFPDDPQLHEATNVMLPQVPLWRGPNESPCALSGAAFNLSFAAVSAGRRSEEPASRLPVLVRLCQRILGLVRSANYPRTEARHYTVWSGRNPTRNRR